MILNERVVGGCQTMHDPNILRIQYTMIKPKQKRKKNRVAPTFISTEIKQTEMVRGVGPNPIA